MRLLITRNPSCLVGALLVSLATLHGAGCAQITDVQPDPAPQGTSMTITGSGFGAAQGTSQLLYDGSPIPVVSWTDPSIVATLPSPKADGTYTLSLVQAGKPPATYAHAIQNPIFPLSVTRAGAGTGTVTSTPAGIDCGETCASMFTSGALITLSAVASPDSTFAGFSGSGCLGTETCQVTMDAAKSVTATFDLYSFQTTFGGTAHDVALAVQQTNDGGYILAGYTYSLGAGSADAYLVKTDTAGNLVWQRTYGGSGWDGVSSVQQTSDGGYILAGNTASFGAGMSDAYLVKVDAAGNPVWQKTFGGVMDDYAVSMQQTSDGGYVLAGSTNSFGVGLLDVYLVKTDAAGNLAWQKTFGGGAFDGAHSVQQTSDGGYILAAYHATTDPYVVKTDASGDWVWQSFLGSSLFLNAVLSVQQTTDGGYIFAGSFFSFITNSTDAYLMKTDFSGTQVWQQSFGGTGSDVGYSVQQASDGGYILAGRTDSFGAGLDDAYLVKVDATGNPVWQKTFGGANDDGAVSVRQTSDGGYVLAGDTDPFGAGSSDAYLVKTDANGNAPATP